MKLLAFLVVSGLGFAGVASWPSLKSDLDYWHAKRAYARLHLGQTKAEVQRVFGLPPFTEKTDSCWTDHESGWAVGSRTYTLCFEHGRLSSKSVE